MIIDKILNTEVYEDVHAGVADAFRFLRNTDLRELAVGRYDINGDKLYALVQEYDTVEASAEKMEGHWMYIDVQCMIEGEELVGHAILSEQEPIEPYDLDKDIAFYSEAPSFYSKMSPGMFMVFFPMDLHVPCIHLGMPARVKKVVVKVHI